MTYACHAVNRHTRPELLDTRNTAFGTKAAREADDLANTALFLMTIASSVDVQNRVPQDTEAFGQNY